MSYFVVLLDGEVIKMPLTIPERKKLRDHLLVKLYNIYFETGEGNKVESMKLDLEERVAYTYLRDKGLVKEIIKTGVRTVELRISAVGIDYVEETLL